ncbi:MAG: hypothetical protein IT481_09475 [Gammaproteobacteria bacterium]|nr:hypothetical protein [Gammaproteobacteria bacterium]
MSRGRAALAGAALIIATATAAALPARAAPPVSPAPAPPAQQPASPAQAPAPAAPPKTPSAPPPATDDAAVDDDLLEFIGSLGDDADGGDWLDFLVSTDVDEAAKPRAGVRPRGR